MVKGVEMETTSGWITKSGNLGDRTEIGHISVRLACCVAHRSRWMDRLVIHVGWIENNVSRAVYECICCIWPSHGQTLTHRPEQSNGSVVQFAFPSIPAEPKHLSYLRVTIQYSDTIHDASWVWRQ